MDELDDQCATWPDAAWLRAFRRKLLAWYATEKREFPWRGTRDLYRIWVSEIMLQQTQTTTVIPYFERFVEAFPTVSALASASEERVLKQWEGLGYYRRARQLHAAAKQICEQHDGSFPETFAEVLALPGIGRYTAGAILSIGRDQQLPILEANTIRLYARLIGLSGNLQKSAAQKTLWRFAETIIPKKQVGDFNQALMELGAAICKPRDPSCLICPAKSECAAFAQNLQDEIPAAKLKPQFETLCEAAVIVVHRERYLVRQRTADEWWTGLWDFPRFKIEGVDDRRIQDQLCRETGISAEIGERFVTIKHGVTRYRITLHCWNANRTAGKIRRGSGYQWATETQLSELPLTTTARRMAKYISA